MPFYVKRTRTQDRPYTPLGKSRIGEVVYSPTMATVELATYEAASWKKTGAWTCEVIEGKRPTTDGGLPERIAGDQRSE